MGTGGELAIKCYTEMGERGKSAVELTRWEEGRGVFFSNRGIGEGGID